MRAPYPHTPRRSNPNWMAVAISTLVCVGKDCEPLGRRAGTEHPKEKGCGVVSPDEGGEDHFVHYTGIEGEGYRSLEEGERVSYEPIRGRKGEQAERVHKVQ